MNKITFTEFIIMQILVGIPFWIISWTGIPGLSAIGNGIVWFWARIKGIKLKTPSQDLLLHLTAPLIGYFGIPSAAGQIILLYTADKVIGEKTSQEI